MNNLHGIQTPRLSRVVFILTAIFLIAPLLILIAYSFNGGKNSWTGFSLRWYEILFTRKEMLWQAFFNSILVSITAGIMATIIGTLSAIGLHWYRFRTKHYIQVSNFIALVLPEIVVGLSLAIFLTSLKINLGLGNVILAHVAFIIPFVTLMVLARLDEFDGSIIEAAEDLGAKDLQILTKVIIPIAKPSIIGGFVTGVTLSLEDFVITLFVGGVGSTTLPVAINNTIRKDPDSNVVYALSVILIAGTVLLVFTARRFLKYIVKT
ncbi:ABC transporter permease [Entomospira entomophila]|uniref:ABC transporter permease n=1 Tax=Entomospira entomophila TaxID=2719988 RepID=UPI001BAFBE47|nr:ABC transporter permease [Entomospira entomophilus]WDI35688.1 ABC transporter permease [Entomospira entomophilus]